jgi:hypothetical protein
MATVSSQIQEIYVGLLGRAADKSGLDYWTAEIDAGTLTVEQLRANIVNEQTEYQEGLGSLTRAQSVSELYARLFERSADAEGLEYWVNGAGATVNVDQLVVALAEGASASDRLVLDNKTTAADYYTNNTAAYDATSAMAAVASVDSTSESVAASKSATDAGSTAGSYELTAGTDKGTDFVGTSAADTFTADLSQNPFAGGVSNTLSSADHLDGQGGTDTLSATVVAEFVGATAGYNIDVQPSTTKIEVIELEARDLMGAAGGAVTVDAKNMIDVDKIGSNFSDADLVIENLTTQSSSGSARNTESITVVMDHTDNFNSDGDASDLTVYFDEDYLLAGQTNTTSQANYWMLDEDSLDYTNEPLLNIERTGVTLTIDGEVVEINMDTDVANAADTWDAFAAGLQAQVEAMVAAGNATLDGVTVSVDTNNTDQTYNDAGNLVTIPAITVTDAQGRDLVPTGFISPADATGAFDIYGRFDNVGSSVTNDPVTVNVELEKVGRDGEGGNLVIGGKDQNTNGDSDVDQVDGIEVFNIAVNGTNDQPSNLGFVSSTNQSLKTVNIADGATWDGADLTIRDAFNGATANTTNAMNVETVNATGFSGDLAIGTATAMMNVDTFTATGGGKVNVVASIDGTEKGTFNYTTGAAEDTIVIDLDGDAVDTEGTISTGLTVNSNGGNDSVTLTMDMTADASDGGVSQTTMSILDNLEINTASGEDMVNLDAYGNFDINTGNDSDFVRINSVDENGNATTGQWTFGQATGAQAFGSRVLFESTLTLTFAGFEQTVSIETDAAGNYVATQLDINAAITKAIADNPELSKLLSVQAPSDTQGVGNQQLVVNSTVGGLNDLSVTINQPQVVEATTDIVTNEVALSSATLSAMVQGLIDTTALTSDELETSTEVVAEMGNNNFGGTIFNGNVGANAVVGADYSAFAAGGSTDATTGINFSTVNLGNGSNDLVVFHSNAASANTLEITGVFGKASVVNFHDVSPNDVVNVTEVGNHAIDFTSILNNQIDPSTNVASNQQSVQSIALTLNNTDVALAGSVAGDNTADANSVNMLAYDQTSGSSTAFASFTAADLVASLNGDASAPVAANFGGIDSTTLSAVTSTANLVGSTQKHIVMVQNSQNMGEYKVFSLTSTVNTTTGSTAGQFDTGSAELLGTLDFGASINFNLIGNATDNAEIKNLILEADGEDPVDPVDPTDPTDPAFNTVTPDATTSVATATDAADAVTFADLTTGQFTVADFNATDDKLVLTGLTGADGSTLADLAGDTIGTGVVGVQVNQIAGSTFVNLGLDADGDVISIELAGITDASLVNVDLA